MADGVPSQNGQRKLYLVIIIVRTTDGRMLFDYRIMVVLEILYYWADLRNQKSKVIGGPNIRAPISLFRSMLLAAPFPHADNLPTRILGRTKQWIMALAGSIG